MPETLTVVTPNFNQEEYLPRCIESVIAQSRAPDEYIILDDGSTDNSAQLIASYADRFPYIRVLQNHENQGVSKAISRAFAAAQGSWIYGLAADDFVLPGFFEEAMRLASQFPTAGIIFGEIMKVDRDGREIGFIRTRRLADTGFVPPLRFRSDFTEVESPIHSHGGATIYRRHAFESSGGFRHELGAYQDTFTPRVLGLRFGACYIDQPCSAWRSLPGSVSAKMRMDLEQQLQIGERVQSLMQGPPFSDIFQPSDVQRWAQAYRRVVLLDHLLPLGASLSDLSASFTGPELHQSYGVLERALVFFARMIVRGARSILWRNT